MAHHDLYDWLLLGTGFTGVASLAGATVGYLRRTVADRRTQAESFYIVSEVKDIPGVPFEEREVQLLLHNGSDRIVSEVVILHYDGAMQAVGVVPPGERRKEVDSALAPGYRFWPHPVPCTFRDARGRRWLRTDDGHVYGPWKTRLLRTLRVKRVRRIFNPKPSPPLESES